MSRSLKSCTVERRPPLSRLLQPTSQPASQPAPPTPHQFVHKDESVRGHSGAVTWAQFERCMHIACALLLLCTEVSSIFVHLRLLKLTPRWTCSY